jgi:ribosome-binding factor A
MAKSYRIERINETIKEILSELVLSQVKDPRVGLVTITAVRVSADMAVAKVHYSVMGDEHERAETHRGLVSARTFMRKTIGSELKMRNAPELRFVYDDSLDRAIAIEQALKEAERPEGEGGDGNEDDE